MGRPGGKGKDGGSVNPGSCMVSSASRETGNETMTILKGNGERVNERNGKDVESKRTRLRHKEANTLCLSGQSIFIAKSK